MLAGEKIETLLTHEPGNHVSIGVLKVVIKSGWFALCRWYWGELSGSALQDLQSHGISWDRDRRKTKPGERSNCF